MKRVVSVSLGSTSRDHKATIQLLGQEVTVERIGTDGDIEKTIQLYNELDGQVDALGVGGIDLTVHVEKRHYPLRGALKLVAGVKQTPVVDGDGLKFTMERRVMQYVEAEIGHEISPKRAMMGSAASRYAMALSFHEAGYDTVYCDLMFALGIPIPVKGIRNLRILAAILMPIVGFLPLSFLYPTGEAQDINVPKYEKYYQWASVVAGDFLYLKRHMPLRMDGKVIVTNTTTQADVKMLTERGVKYLVTTTPRLEGRSFGTNVMEGALVAVAGKGRKLTTSELDELIEELGLRPTIEKLN
jgi:hypothetical protein